MNTSFWVMILEIVIFLPFILLIIYASLKFGGGKLQQIQNGRYIKVHERTALSKDSSLMVVQMGKRGYVISAASGKIEILKELEDEELREIIEVHSIPQYKNLTEIYKNFKLRRKE